MKTVTGRFKSANLNIKDIPKTRENPELVWIEADLDRHFNKTVFKIILDVETNRRPI